MIKTIYIVRHAQTDLNHHKILQGSRVDHSLNLVGKKQSKLFYEAYKDIVFQKIYTSPLKRAIESVEQFIANGIPYEQIEDLKEIDYGIYDGIASSENEDIYQKLKNDWNQGLTDAKITMGESPEEVSIRMKRFADQLLAKENENTVLICMHGRAMKVLLTVLLGADLRYMDAFPHANMGLYVIRYKNSLACIECMNKICHLNSLSDQLLSAS